MLLVDKQTSEIFIKNKHTWVLDDISACRYVELVKGCSYRSSSPCVGVRSWKLLS